MRTLLAILVFLSAQCAMAQTTHLPLPASPYAPGSLYWLPSPFTGATFAPIDFSSRKWQLVPFSSVSVGYVFSKYGGASYVSAPMGLMLAKPLNNNFSVFSAVSATPTFFNMGSYPGTTPGTYHFGVNPAVTGGLIYTNDDRTFSISGSISVERGSYPVYRPSNQTSQQVGR